VYGDEVTGPVRHVFELVRERGAWVPGLWKLEVANILEMGVRRGRHTAAFRNSTLTDLALLPIQVDAETDRQERERRRDCPSDTGSRRMTRPILSLLCDWACRWPRWIRSFDSRPKRKGLFCRGVEASPQLVGWKKLFPWNQPDTLQRLIALHHIHAVFGDNQLSLLIRFAVSRSTSHCRHHNESCE
jgi:hypothetical protein